MQDARAGRPPLAACLGPRSPHLPSLSCRLRQRSGRSLQASCGHTIPCFRGENPSQKYARPPGRPWPAMTMTNTSTASRLRALERHIQASGAAGGEHEGRKEGPGGFLSGVPPYFVKSGLEAFRAARMQESDVVMVSYPKCGTSWLHQVLFCLLRMDDTGQFAGDVQAILGSKGQVYPDGIEAEGEGQEGKFSGATVADLLGQPVRPPPAPRAQLRGPLTYAATSPRCLSLSLSLTPSGPCRRCCCAGWGWGEGRL
eukprot:COSAG01_NODE_21917_length_879_cov_1.752564_1_plen_255_part_10